MISHLNGNFRASAARSTESLTSSRTTNVPTAPMLTTPNFANCSAICVGWQRFAPPTFIARRNTTQLISKSDECCVRSGKKKILVVFAVTLDENQKGIGQ